MNKFKGIIILTMIAILMAACQAATPTITATQAPTEPPATPTPRVEVLQVVAGDTTKSFTLAEIQALPKTEGYAGIKSSTGKITLPALFTGVSLADLATLVGGIDTSKGLELLAVDGYSMTYSFDQVANGTFTTYDPGTGDETTSGGKLTPILAYAVDGKPLDPQTDGYLRLAVVSEKNNQVVDGHWSVKWVNKVTIKPLAAEWTLHLEGALTEDMDRATYTSGIAPGCHGQNWTDDKAQVWTGIPLWYLVGRVDDQIKHDGPAFNDALAASGYKVVITAADGYSVTFDSQRVARNNNLIIAGVVNGNELPEDSFPLKLVGSDVSKAESIGQIVSIVIQFP
jgi:DMSO/TMAO reductase YedYZ molybdopterin-dependent catalytic subunit